MRISSDWSQTVQQLCQWCNRAIGKVSWNLCQADLQSCIGFRLLPHFVLLAWKACRTALRSPHSSLLLLKQHICTTAMKFRFHSLSWIRFLVIFFFFSFCLSNCKASAFFIRIVIIPFLKHIDSESELGSGPYSMFQFFSWWTNRTD